MHEYGRFYFGAKLKKISYSKWSAGNLSAILSVIICVIFASLLKHDSIL